MYLGKRGGPGVRVGQNFSLALEYVTAESEDDRSET